MCVLCIFIMYIEIDTHVCIYVRKICYICILNKCIYTFNYMNINIYCTCVCVCIYVYIINIHITHTYIICKQKLLFWMWLIATNRLIAAFIYVFALFPVHVFVFLHICHIWMIQIIKHILILHKDNSGKYKCSFEIMISFIKGKKLSTPAWHYVKNELPPTSNNRLCHPLQQQLQSSVYDNWQWVFHIAVDEFWPTLLCRIISTQPHWRVFEHEWTV